MKLKLKAISTLMLLFVGMQISLFAQSNIVDEVVWVVGDEAILRSDVEKARMMSNRVSGNPYCVLPEQLAVQKLFLHQADIDSVEVTSAMVNAQVESQLNEWVMMAGSKEKLEEYRNMTMTQIREDLYDQLYDYLRVEAMRKKLTEGMKITPAEVRRYFKDMPEDSLPLIPTQVEVQIITMQPRIPQEEIDRVKEELREYTERVTNGNTSFSTLAILYSEDPGTARRGGEMDYAGRGELDPAFANVAFSLTDPKKISKIAESEYGFHIIQLIDKRGDKVKVRHILKRPKLAQEDIDEAICRLDTIAEEIRAGKFSFEEGAQYLSDDKNSRNNKGVMMNNVVGSSGYMEHTSRFEMQDLPQEIARVVEGMNTGEISKPFTMINEKGKEVCAIVKLKMRIKAHKASMTEDFQVLKDMVLAKKKEDKVEQWIRDKQRTTYVRINENWRNCEFQYPGWIK
ncbi:MAG: peptidylprolyl isomerase [Paraprevotella sp.]|nr:peptidylprolyl isomerase [Paraprevotella sp.]